jgi:hypothetical protein
MVNHQLWFGIKALAKTGKRIDKLRYEGKGWVQDHQLQSRRLQDRFENKKLIF